MNLDHGTEVFILKATGYSSKYIHTKGVIQNSLHRETGRNVRLFDGKILYFYKEELTLYTKIKALLYGV